jgi:hypothetical protein
VTPARAGALAHRPPASKIRPGAAVAQRARVRAADGVGGARCRGSRTNRSEVAARPRLARRCPVMVKRTDDAWQNRLSGAGEGSGAGHDKQPYANGRRSKTTLTNA